MERRSTIRKIQTHWHTFNVFKTKQLLQLVLVKLSNNTTQLLLKATVSIVYELKII